MGLVTGLQAVADSLVAGRKAKAALVTTIGFVLLASSRTSSASSTALPPVGSNFADYLSTY